MSDNLCELVKAAAHRFEEEDNAAYSLWTWLPSYKVATKHHGDYAANFRPSLADILRESTDVIAEAHGHPMSEQTRAEWNECPCGEEHEEGRPS